MAEFLLVTGPSHRGDVVPVAGTRITVGRSNDSDIALSADSSVSRLHAVIENYGAGWCVRDLGSRNGTFVNGDRIWGDRALRPGDEILIGATRLLFTGQAPNAAHLNVTTSIASRPILTRREREVLVALCRPTFARDVFAAPASVRQIATDLHVTQDAVKQHLGRLYDKFKISDSVENRRVELARQAITTAAVSMTDL